MDNVVIVLVAGVISVVIVMIGRVAFRNARRTRLMNTPFPSSWEKILQQNVALYRHLSNSLKRQLHGDIQIFLAEKNFEGCGGLEMTDEIRVTIAAQACILLLNRKTKFYPGLSSILVYPSAYIAEKITYLGAQHIREKTVRLGESWQRGAVVLAWDHVKHGSRDVNDGHNVVLHEFAHQLDQEDGRSDGVPILEQRSSYVAWARILGKEYENLRKSVKRNKRDVMDNYGAKNPAEFFAVATETFFEKPKQIKQKHPDLYEELKDYYKLNPIEWVES